MQTKKWLYTAALSLWLALPAAAMANEGAEHHGGPPSFMEDAMAKLPADKAAAFKDTMKKQHEKDKDIFVKLHQLHEDMNKLLIAPKFDKAAYLAKASEIEKEQETMHANMSAAFATAVSTLSQDERKVLAENMHPPGMMHHGEHEDHDNAGSATPPGGSR
jgi:uncharacterized membrane protein